MKIDAYSHILPPRYFKRMQDIAVDPGSLTRWLNLSALHDVEFRLAMMDEFGADFQQVLTLSSPPIELLAEPEESPELARLANESMAELCEQHPARFPMFVASLPMNNVEACLTEAAYAIDHLGACGVQVFTNMNGIPLNDERFSAIFRDLAGRDLPSGCIPPGVEPRPTMSRRTPRSSRSGGRWAGRTKPAPQWPGWSSPASSMSTPASRS